MAPHRAPVFGAQPRVWIAVRVSLTIMGVPAGAPTAILLPVIRKDTS